MLYSEIEALERVKSLVTQDVAENKFELFVEGRDVLTSSTYKVNIIMRITPDVDAEKMTVAFMRLFIQEQDISFIKSYTAIIAERNIRVVDFLLEATILPFAFKQ